jgi:hypothetical protein
MRPEATDKILDVTNPEQVSSPRVLDVMLGAPVVERLLILTGIAIPEWDSQGHLDPKRVWVDLGLFPKRVVSYTAVTGLAALGAGSDGFAMGTDAVSVELRDDTGELALVCDIQVSGKPGWLHRIAYQASVIVEVESPLIAGTIRWQPAALGMLRQTNLFTVVGHSVEVIPPAPGSGGFTKSIVHDIARAGESDRPVQDEDGFIKVPYVLSGELPLNLDITVAPSAIAGAFSVTPDRLAFDQVAGPRPVRLTPSNPQVFGVDFEMLLRGGPG